MSDTRLKPIPIVGLHTKYLIQLDNGLIYTRKSGSLVPTFIENDELCVKLRPEGADEDATMSVTELLMNCIYGYTGLKPSERIQETPCDTHKIYPLPRPIYDIDPNDPLSDIMIGDLLYKRWNGSKYFVNKYGAVFSEPYGAFIKQTYNDSEYRSLSLSKRTFRVQRIVWEAWNGKTVPEGFGIEHIDTLRWHNELSNIRIVAYIKNLNFINSGIGWQTVPEEAIKTMVEIANYLKTANESYEEIAKKFGVEPEIVTDLALTTKYNAVLKKYTDTDDTLPKKYKYAFLTPEKIRTIKEASAHGMSDTSIMKEFGVTANVLAGIFNRYGLSDMPIELRNAFIMYYHH